MSEPSAAAAAGPVQRQGWFEFTVGMSKRVPSGHLSKAAKDVSPSENLLPKEPRNPS